MAPAMVEQLEPWSQLEGKIVLVTGAFSGLGLEFCLDLAKAGCRIVAAARRTDRLNSLCDQINKMDDPTVVRSGGSPRAIAVELDITANGSTIEACVKKAWNAFGHIDALVNNAGVRGQIKTSLELCEKEWNNVVTTNMIGSWLVSKCVGARMHSVGRGGSIINISSISGLNRGQKKGGVAYSSSKAGLDTMTKVMTVELGDYNLRVNGIAPGLFKSEITQQLIEKKWLKSYGKKIVPLRTFGTSDPALTSLVHDSSSYISGNIFIVDAGNTVPGFPIFSSL
ncbi:hypothetical protein ACS0TY_031050 [Phlomoides rotata]